MRNPHLPVSTASFPRRCGQLAVAAIVGLPLLAACGSSGTTSSATTAAPTTASPTTAAPTTTSAGAATTAARGSGPVNVLYAGSLAQLLGNQIGPAFQSATGYTFNGFSGDSGELASQIKSKVRQGDVYISANPKVDAKLQGAANGDWVSWYANFATSPLVIGYNPKSKFAHQLETEPWYKVVGQPGFLLGRTDPATDPKGVLTVTALEAAATADNEPALKQAATSSTNVFPENTLVGRLQAGQLDAGFFYRVEATTAKIPTVTLTGQTLKAVYTISVLNRAPHSSGANAFVTYLLGPTGAAALKAGGIDLTTPAPVTGTAPSGLQSVLSGG